MTTTNNTNYKPMKKLLVFAIIARKRENYFSDVVVKSSLIAQPTANTKTICTIEDFALKSMNQKSILNKVYSYLAKIKKIMEKLDYSILEIPVI